MAVFCVFIMQKEISATIWRWNNRLSVEIRAQYFFLPVPQLGRQVLLSPRPVATTTTVHVGITSQTLLHSPLTLKMLLACSPERCGKFESASSRQRQPVTRILNVWMVLKKMRVSAFIFFTHLHKMWPNYCLLVWKWDLVGILSLSLSIQVGPNGEVGHLLNTGSM